MDTKDPTCSQLATLLHNKRTISYIKADPLKLYEINKTNQKLAKLKEIYNVPARPAPLKNAPRWYCSWALLRKSESLSSLNFICF